MNPRARPWKGDQGYDPRVHAPVIAMGGTLIESGIWAGRYRLDDFVVDDFGAMVDTDACPECGGDPYRVQLEVNPNPFAKPWEQTFTHCRRCVTPAMLAENEARVNGSPPRR